VVIGLSERDLVVLAWEEDGVVECHSDRRRANLFPQGLLVHLRTLELMFSDFL
jgi:hypothetical protein